MYVHLDCTGVLCVGHYCGGLRWIAVDVGGLVDDGGWRNCRWKTKFYKQQTVGSLSRRRKCFSDTDRHFAINTKSRITNSSLLLSPSSAL